MHSLCSFERWAIYQTVVYMAWSDRRLAATEVSAARAIAEELDLVVDGASRPGSVLAAGVPALGELGLDDLSVWGRQVAYASAAWMALADGVQHRVEGAVLRTLRFRLQIPSVTADLIEASAMLVRAHGGRTPPRTEYRALLQALLDVVLPLGSGVDPSEPPTPLAH